MSSESETSSWAQIPTIYKAIATIIVVFVGGMGFGFQILQVTALPERLQTSEAVLDDHFNQIDELRDLIESNTRQINGLICLQRVETSGVDAADCILN